MCESVCCIQEKIEEKLYYAYFYRQKIKQLIVKIQNTLWFYFLGAVLQGYGNRGSVMLDLRILRNTKGFFQFPH